MMETRAEQSLAMTVRFFAMLTKPGIIFGNAVTGFAGFALAAKGNYDLLLFFAAMMGLSLIVASGCVYNNFIDRVMDKKMARTRERALARGLISPTHALFFAATLGIIGSILLVALTNPVALSVALFGLLVYVCWYSPAKYRTVHATLIGSIAGAIPPVVGYTAVTGRVDLGALLLFALIVFWQMPHFYAIALYRQKEYAAASIPVFPLVKGSRATKIHMMFYMAGFLVTSFLFTFLGYTGVLWLTVIAALGFIWVWMGLKGFTSTNEKKWARKMFLFSLVVVMGLSIAVPFSTVP
jgi:protoheme IX farnesyltransferase